MMRRDPYARRMRRARRTWGRREDAYPLLILGPDEPYAFLALAAAGRWIFRHRSALLPFLVAASAFGCAYLAHRHHPMWWIAVAVATMAVTILLGIPHRIVWSTPAGAVTTGLVSRLWLACGIDRLEERVYATVVVAATGGWTAAAIATGPATPPLPTIAMVATVVLGIPWWAHRRRRARARVERTIQAWPSLAENFGLPGSRIASAVVDAWGWTARVILKKGATVEQAISKIPEIESGLGVRPGSVRVTPDQARADRLILRVIETDPHAEPIPWSGTSVTSITQPIKLGLAEDGRPVRVVILRRHVLVGGIAGSGKSGIVNILLANLATCHDVLIWGVDLKGGMELGPWADCLDRLAITPDQATKLFKDAVEKLNQRAQKMAARGARVWEPTPEDPALVIVVDEYAELPEQAHVYADSIARRGRAVAVTLVAATQRPTQDAMGNQAVRSQMDVRICLRVRERRDVDLILGQGAFHAGWHAHRLSLPGEFLISDPEHLTPERHRAYRLTDAQVTRHAAQHARPRLTIAEESPQKAPERPQGAVDGPTHAEGPPGPEAALWEALRRAGADGASVADLMAATGMTRATLYRRLRGHARSGRVASTRRGHWRALPPEEGPADRPDDGRPPPRPPAPGRPGTGPDWGRRRPPNRDAP